MDDEPFYLVEPTQQFDSVNVSALAHWNLNEVDVTVQDRLFWGIEKNKCTFVRDGINAGVALKDAFSEEGFTPLTFAARSGAVDMVQMLLDLGLNPAFSGIKLAKFNALHAAARGGHLNVVQRLLARAPEKININMVDHRKQTALHHAISQTRFDLALKLINQFDASMKIGDYRGRNALARAFGCLFVETYDKDIKKNNRVQELENFCIALIEKQNPFEASAPDEKYKYIAPIEVILTPHLALHQADMPKEKRHADPRSTHDAIAQIMMEMPLLAAKLYAKAHANPARDFENTYIHHYEMILREPKFLTDEEKAELKTALTSELKKDK